MVDQTRHSGAPSRRFAPVAEQMEILMRGVDYGDRELGRAMERELATRLEEARAADRPLTVYVGIDPTGTELTLGHTVPLRKLRQFQDLGHRAVFVIGDFTARIGDPSDKEAARRQLTDEEVKANAADFVAQAARVLDPATLEVRYNGDWLGRLRFADLIDLASHFTVGQFLQRDNFGQRFARGDAIWLHEFFYALMQAYDAVALDTDVQIGGTEQLFNLMAGRKLQEAFGQRPQVPITLPILVGTDGHLRMSKTSGNYVGISEPPEEQFGKTMSLPDDAMANWFGLVTSWSPAQIRSELAAVAAGDRHPMETKKALAREIVSLFHGDSAAESAEAHFKRTVQAGAAPDTMPELALESPQGLLDLMTAAGLAPSKSQARRLVEQGGVRLDGVVVSDLQAVLAPAGADRVLQVGKRGYLKVLSARSNT